MFLSKNQYIPKIIAVWSMIFFISAHIAEQNAGICSPNMILGDNFNAGIVIYVFTKIRKEDINGSAKTQ